MAFSNMYQELLGIPGTNLGLVRTKINEAFTAIQNENVWSFQIRQGGWLTPGLLGGATAQSTFLSPGAITTTPFSPTVIGDAVATAAWLATITSPPFITQYQIRSPYYSIYNIIALGSYTTVAYITIFDGGSGQTPGTYIVNATGGGGTGAQASIVVDSTGVVSATPTILNAGTGYTSVPTFTVPAGGTTATLIAVLNATLTLDRPWMEPAQTLGNYMAYQCYFPGPSGFKKWMFISDTTNNQDMDWWSMSQADLSDVDPQRTDFSQPQFVVPYAVDTRTGSATYGQMLFELWQGPITQLPYTWQALANWPALVSPTDTLPYPITEELVKLRAMEMIAIWKETQKGDDMERGSGADWKFVTEASNAEYRNRLKECRNMDRNQVDLYFSRMKRRPANITPFASVDGQMNVGS